MRPLGQSMASAQIGESVRYRVACITPYSVVHCRMKVEGAKHMIDRACRFLDETQSKCVHTESSDIRKLSPKGGLTCLKSQDNPRHLYL